MNRIPSRTNSSDPAPLSPPFEQNQLLALLSSKDRQQLLSLCKPVDLTLSEVLCEADRPLGYVYFPTSGYISLVSMVCGEAGMGVGMIGREGMVGSHLALGVHLNPFRALVQGKGSAWRVAAIPFVREIKRSRSLRRWMNRYLYVQMRQLTTASTCMRFHSLQPRLARWLLMSQDRAQQDQFPVTQSFLAYLLGVRRVGVTAAAVALQRSGIIEYHRGRVRVVSRSGLEASACSCYQSDLEIYAAIMRS